MTFSIMTFFNAGFKARFKRAAAALGFAAALSACTTTPSQPAPQMPNQGSNQTSNQVGGTVVVPAPIPQPAPSRPAPTQSWPTQPAPVQTPNTSSQPYAPAPSEPYTQAPIVEVYPAPASPSPVNPYASATAALSGWSSSDVTPALISFQRSCKEWASKSQSDNLDDNLWQYGRYSDWAAPCAAAQQSSVDYGSAHDFFERYFTPVRMAAATDQIGQDAHAGLLTGYYQPEIEVRRRADVYFNEPILAKPKSDGARTLPRSQINAATSRVIGYGRPLDVFFMQVQGSGHIRYENGAKIRAAYAGNNGHPYKSIGKVLIERGEITKERSSKADIERWMAENGGTKARELINQNKRYIYFVEEKIKAGEGPKGAMRVPLTAMGSMAVDPSYYPYGALVWLNVNLPQYKGDYRGTQQGILLSAQDTGKAIRGARRGDLYFGSGTDAGDLAGVMKHSAQWSVLLPNALAARLNDQGIG